MLLRLTTTMLAFGLLVGACGGPGGPGAEPPATTPVAIELDPDDARRLAAASNAFGFDLLAELHTGENSVTSPLSAAVLLAMVLAGAEGETAEAIADALHLDGTRDEGYAALLFSLTDTDDVDLQIANSLWAGEGVPFEEDYIRHARDAFGATVEAVDLGSRAAAERIDDWVRERTNDRIDGIAEDLGLPNPQSVLVLLNAVYFLGTWTDQFDEGFTADGPFTLADGTSPGVPLMHHPDIEMGHASMDGFEVLRMPYGDDERFTMDVFLPDGVSDLTGLVADFDAEAWEDGVGALSPTNLAVTLPRFEIEWDAELNDALIALGMEPAFSGAAQFRPMSPADPFLSTVVQKTYVRVDEEGTEAAAVTGGEMAVSAPAAEFRADRPFLFTISDTETGAILFAGAVTDPRG